MSTPAPDWFDTVLPSLHPTEGPRIDGSKVRFWATKRDAVAAAKAIGWPANSVNKVHTRFCAGWAICQTNGGFLGREEYGALHLDRNGA